jgi:hypothetical protein
MRNVLSIAAAALAGAVLVGGAVAVQTRPAEAGASTGTWKYGAPYRGYRGGYAYRGGYGYRPYRRYGGGAVAAGVATGLALGAVGAAAASPYYGYPAYGAAPVYGGDCYLVDRRGYDEQVCD